MKKLALVGRYFKSIYEVEYDDEKENPRAKFISLGEGSVPHPDIIPFKINHTIFIEVEEKQ